MPNVVSGTSEKLEKLRKADARKVKGTFFCHEPKGGDVKFPFKKYKGDVLVNYHLEDGKEYDLPVGVIKHLNNCGWDVHSHLLDAQGNPCVGTGKKERRFTFQGADLI